MTRGLTQYQTPSVLFIRLTQTMYPEKRLLNLGFYNSTTNNLKRALKNVH